MTTNRNLLRVADAVLAAAEKGLSTVELNGVLFDDIDYNASKGGRCQETVRKTVEAASGRPMPGASCCAGQTFRNLLALPSLPRVVQAYGKGGRPSQASPGDILFFASTPTQAACHTCRGWVGHVGIWLGGNRLFQHTSRGGLGITDQGPTDGQVKRFVGAYRLFPLDEPPLGLDNKDADAQLVLQDVQPWARADVEWAVEMGLYALDSSGCVRGSETVTKQTLAAFLHRLYKRVHPG